MSEREQIFPPSFYIKKEMQKRGLTQADMAVITGRYPSEVSNSLAIMHFTIPDSQGVARRAGLGSAF